MFAKRPIRGLIGAWLVSGACGLSAPRNGAVARRTKEGPKPCQRRPMDPARTVVERPCGTAWIVLTDGARTAVIQGAERRFTEEGATVGVVTRSWVRALPSPFVAGGEAEAIAWLERAADRTDVLATAMQYVAGAPPVVEGGLQIGGDAGYGPLNADGQRVEGADFNDYLQIPWTYPDGTVDRPEPAQRHALDCSGYMRMIWGYRSGVPLGPNATPAGGVLPRRAVQMAAAPVGTLVIPDEGRAPAALERLQAGDLLFFDADPSDGPAVDHVGMYLGRDEAGHARFVSSRKSIDGPTLGDHKGASVLDGPGLYARAFRSARRL